MFPVFPTWLILLVFGFPACALAVVAGGLVCLILRQHWGLRAALIDAVLALVVFVISAYAITAIAMSLGTLQRGAAPGAWLDYTVTTASVVVRHLTLLTLRSSNVHRSRT